MGGYAAALHPDQAPTEYKTAGTFMLIGGLTTLLSSAIVFACLVWVCIGVCWLPFVALAIWALVCGVRATGGVRVPEIRLANALGLVAAMFCCDVVGFVFQVLALVWLAREDVSRWIERPA
jgi:hypothetical protein